MTSEAEAALSARQRFEIRLWIVQRLTAMLLALAVPVHLAVIFYAVHRGLSAEAILARTRGSLAWLLFYGLFATIAAVHGSIGLRAILKEVTGLKGYAVDLLAALFALLLTALGWRAVFALFG